MTKKYYSDQTKFVHEAAQGFLESGLITKNEMKEFNQGCLVNEKEKQTLKQNQQTKTRKTITRKDVRQTQLKKAS